MTARSIMFQGTASDVGKSVIVAGLCRLAANRGIRVAPFKPQNMSNNAAVCADGGEIGRAQALQARACRLAPSIHFNPVLLKPESDKSSQVIVQGRVTRVQSARDYMINERRNLLTEVMDSFQQLQTHYDLILVEGAGSPAEVNLRQGDIANMGFASAAGVPVCLIGDIDRGGVIAAIAGTQAVLADEDRKRLKSFIINRFRGDVTLFDEGIQYLTETTGLPCHGIIPWLPFVRHLPQEDAVILNQPTVQHPSMPAGNLKIAAPMLSRIANFDDLDPLRLEAGVEVIFVPPGDAIPLDAAAVILLGTKSTLSDLAFLKAQGWDHDIIALARHGRTILGICGGMQLLGNKIEDPTGIDGTIGQASGLGLLDIDTTMMSEKTVTESEGIHLASGYKLRGYEIHTGRTSGPDTGRPFANLTAGHDGAISAAGNVLGTYLHGLFSSDEFRRSWLSNLHHPEYTASITAGSYEEKIDQLLDELGVSLEHHLDIDSLLAEAMS